MVELTVMPSFQGSLRHSLLMQLQVSLMLFDPGSTFSCVCIFCFQP